MSVFYSSIRIKIKVTYERCSTFCYKKKRDFVASPLYRRTSERARNARDAFSSYCNRHESLMKLWLLILGGYNCVSSLFTPKVIWLLFVTRFKKNYIPGNWKRSISSRWSMFNRGVPGKWSDSFPKRTSTLEIKLQESDGCGIKLQSLYGRLCYQKRNESKQLCPSLEVFVGARRYRSYGKLSIYEQDQCWHFIRR